ncbi:C40 family peptidase [Streptomyces sp.]|uniref:C40 family peptidase n=1 Tax=Streptomyces sp. TaxID=1931 RepID=UPI002D794392|nr:NlpC/P60 family protein [Streptomyces sp.]HET6358244.1 NlpC/P60 family protein [Streptomyces sp.]
MPALASHRKERSRTTTSPAVGLTTAAIAGVTLLSTQSAGAAPTEPKPSIEEVQKKVDDLYRQAGTATEKYNKAKESTDAKRAEVDELLDDAATRTEKLNESRRVLGNYAATQYRTGAVTPTAALLFADSPQAYFDQTQLMDRMTDRQRTVIDDYETQRAADAKQRAAATEKLESLTLSQKALRTSKQEVQAKLAEARALLSKLTAEEKARLAALERQKQEEARLKAEAQAKAEAEARAKEEAAAEAARQQQEAAQSQDTSTGTGTDTGTSTGTGTADSTYAAKADKVLAFARAQIGKPYVWGASGPSSYDCSGLTQAAWKAAGVDLPRTTWDQVNVGTRVATKDLLPGDLVFFYDDISHVGIYIGDGMMIHAPKPGTNVREESIYYMPIYGSVRPA